MSKRPESSADDLAGEYDFSQGVRGRYADKYAAGTNIVVLAPDVAELFPDSASVNAALRLLADLARRQAARSSTDSN